MRAKSTSPAPGLRAVAQRAGVSIATVSHVLNGRDDRVSAVTRERVFEAVRDLNYRAPAVDRRRTAGTRVLGVIAGDLTHSPLLSNLYAGRSVDAIFEAAAFRGWALYLQVQRMWHASGTSVRSAFDGRCDAVIALAPTVSNELVPQLVARGVPVVQIGTTSYDPRVSSVDVDNEGIGRQAAQYLLERGHRRIGFVGFDAQTMSSVERAKGLRYGVETGGGEYFEFAHSEAVQSHLVSTSRDRCTGFLAWNDQEGRRLCSLLQRTGIAIPTEVSVIGVDDAPEATSAAPGLTTFAQPLREIALRAFEMATHLVEHAGSGGEVVRYAAPLVERDSVARITGRRP